VSQRHLKLDFQARRSRLAWPAALALLLGLAASAFCVARLQEALDRVTRLEAEIGALGGGRRAAAARAHAPEALAHAQAVAQGIARRWDRVFLALESASTPQVALLAIEPDTRGGRLRITAEAKGMGAMLGYLARLQEARPLERVVLDQHEVLQTPEKPVRFVVSAQWRDAP
jgi:hypothetical protein